MSYVVRIWAIEYPDEIRYMGPPSVIGDDFCQRFPTDGINSLTARFPTREDAERAWAMGNWQRYSDVTICHELEEVPSC